MKSIRWGKSLLWVGVVLAFILLLLVLFPHSGAPIPFKATPEVRSLVEGNSAFSIDLYRQLAKRPGNLFFSPQGISTCLAITYAGARGQTEKEMAAALHFNLPQPSLPGAFNELAERNHRIQRWHRIALTSANSLWLQQDYRFSDDFLAQVRTSFLAEARQVDFKRDPQGAAAQINRWANEATDGKIGSAAKPAQFSPLSRLVLCNAIHFKGTWKDRFDRRDTAPRLFHVTTNEAVTVPMMHRKAHFKTTYSDDGNLLLLELPYSGDDLSMVILLPRISEYLPMEERFSLDTLEAVLSWDNLNGWLNKLDQSSRSETAVSLPRFTARRRYDLATELKGIGFASMFNASANLSGMDGTSNLFVSELTHEAFVEVNETGTEAAAMTLMRVATRGMSSHVVVDHPFMFLIRDRASGSILFLGRIVDPTQ